MRLCIVALDLYGESIDVCSTGVRTVVEVAPGIVVRGVACGMLGGTCGSFVGTGMVYRSVLLEYVGCRYLGDFVGLEVWALVAFDVGLASLVGWVLKPVCWLPIALGVDALVVVVVVF